MYIIIEYNNYTDQKNRKELCMLGKYQLSTENVTCTIVLKNLEQYSLLHFIKNLSNYLMSFISCIFHLNFVKNYFSFRVYYAFVTYSEKAEAERAINHGNDQNQVQLDIRFGERKQTQTPYYDLGEFAYLFDF